MTDHAVGPHPGPPDLLGLPLRDADHPIHPPQAGPIEGLVDPDLPGLRRPAMRHRDHGHARPPRRQQADDVGLVAVAAEDVGIPFPEPARQLAHHGGKMGSVVGERDRLQPVVEKLPAKGLALPLVGEEDEGRPAGFRQALRQPQHQPLRAAEERRGRQVQDDHRFQVPSNGIWRRNESGCRSLGTNAGRLQEPILGLRLMIPTCSGLGG